jgi:hypothetical protein
MVELRMRLVLLSLTLDAWRTAQQESGAQQFRHTKPVHELSSQHKGDLMIPDPGLFGSEVKARIHDVGLLHLDDPEGHALDEMGPSAIGLTNDEQAAIQEAVGSMAAARVSKAQRHSPP